MINTFQDFITSINFFDIFVVIILLYNVLQCFFKGFSLSLISFSKWVVSTIVTIINNILLYKETSNVLLYETNKPEKKKSNNF